MDLFRFTKIIFLIFLLSSKIFAYSHMQTLYNHSKRENSIEAYINYDKNNNEFVRCFTIKKSSLNRLTIDEQFKLLKNNIKLEIVKEILIRKEEYFNRGFVETHFYVELKYENKENLKIIKGNCIKIQRGYKKYRLVNKNEWKKYYYDLYEEYENYKSKFDEKYETLKEKYDEKNTVYEFKINDKVKFLSKNQDKLSPLNKGKIIGIYDNYYFIEDENYIIHKINIEDVYKGN